LTAGEVLENPAHVLQRLPVARIPFARLFLVRWGPDVSGDLAFDLLDHRSPGRGSHQSYDDAYADVQRALTDH